MTAFDYFGFDHLAAGVQSEKGKDDIKNEDETGNRTEDYADDSTWCGSRIETLVCGWYC